VNVIVVKFFLVPALLSLNASYIVDGKSSKME